MNPISVIVVIIVGALVGWVASMIMNTDRQQGALLNITVGIVGALIGGWLFGSVIGIDSASTAGSLSVPGVFWALLGAIIFVLILKGIRLLR